MHLISRQSYLNLLEQFRNQPLVKVITGMRRTGKSTLLSMWGDVLKQRGIKEKEIICINFEDMAFDDIRDYHKLYAYIKAQTQGLEYAYLLLDEVQHVEAWEKAINSLLYEGNSDIYVTGSNAWLLSSELATLIAGRYVEIRIFPLSFKEYFTHAVSNRPAERAFAQYLRYGGLPAVLRLPQDEQTIQTYLDGIYNTVILNDVISRNAVRDASLLQNVIRYLAANIGSPVSTSKISGYLTSKGRKTTAATIDSYLKMLEGAFIFHRAERYDIKGKLYLKTLEKYYIADIGLRNSLLGFSGEDYGHVLENVVYLELLRRGYQVGVGKLDQLEIDFLAQKPDRKIYIQVAASAMDEEVLHRELAPLRRVADNYEKVLLTMDHTYITDYNGIRNMHLMDWLLEENPVRTANTSL